MLNNRTHAQAHAHTHCTNRHGVKPMVEDGMAYVSYADAYAH